MKDIACKRISEIRIKLASLICEQLKGTYKEEYKAKLIYILSKTGIGNVYNLIYDYASKNSDNCDALVALSRYDRPESLDFFKEKLENPRSLHRDLMVECLGNYNKPELVNYIKTFLADEDRQVRYQAIYALYNIGGKEAALAMCDYISDPDEWISMTILRLLCKMKVLDTIPILTEKYYADNDLRRKALMISFLSRFRSITLLEAFDDALQARDARLRANAIEAIGELKLPEEELSKRIVPFLNDPNNRIRANAILAMAKITPEKVKAQIIEMCNSDDVQLRRSAAFILCMIPPNDFFKEAEKLITDENDTVRKRMIQSLKNFPHHFISSNINKVLSDENKWIRKYAIDMISGIPAFESTPIVNILRSEQAAPNIEACLNFLVSHPSENAMSSLRVHFKDQRLPVVKGLLKALLAIGGVEEVKKMAPRLEQRDPLVVQNITSTMLESGSLETLNEFLSRFQKVKTNNNLELILPSLEVVVDIIVKGEKMPPKLLKALSDEPIQNMGYASQVQPQQFARPQQPNMFVQPMQPNMVNQVPQQPPVPQIQVPQQPPAPQIQVTQPQYTQNQYPTNTEIPQQPVQDYSTTQENINIQQPAPQSNQDSLINFDMFEQTNEVTQTVDVNAESPQMEEQGFNLNLEIPQELMQSDQATDYDTTQSVDQNSQMSFDNQTQQQPPQEFDNQQVSGLDEQSQLFQELPNLNNNVENIPVNQGEPESFDLNNFNFDIIGDSINQNDSSSAPSFNDLIMPNAPEVAINRKPSTPHYKAGLKAYNLGKYPKAVEEFNKSIALNENPPKAINLYLGIMLTDLNEYEDAIKHLAAFLKTTPDNAKAAYLLGKCYRKTKDWEKVITTYQPFIEGELEASPKMKKRIYQDMGSACAITGKSETAIRLLTALYKLETDNAEIGYYLAMALFKMKKTSEAAVVIDKAAKNAPKGKNLEKQINSLSQAIRSGVPLAE